jgi:hypothetical protein
MDRVVTTVREHSGLLSVAALTVAAAFAQGLFAPKAYAAASVVLWGAVIAGLAGRTLPSAQVGGIAAAAGFILAATAVLAMASVGWASDQGRAFEEAVRVSFYLGLFTLAACTASRAVRAEWLKGVALGLGLVSVVALFSYLQPNVLQGGRLEGEVPNASARLSYPIGYWNGAAALFAVAAVLLAHFGAHAGNRQLRSMAVAVAPLALLGIWLASSRGGAVAAVLGLAVLLAASPDRSRQLVTLAIIAAAACVLIVVAEQMHALTSQSIDSARRADGDRMSAVVLLVAGLTAATAWLLDRRRLQLPRRAVIGAGIAALVVLAAGIALSHPVERFDEFKAPPSGGDLVGRGLSSDGRWQFWGGAIDAFESAPIAGLGAGGYEQWWAKHASVALFVRNPHSLPLQQAAELGLIGLALFLAFAAAVMIAARRRLAAGLEGDGGLLVAILVATGFCAAIDWTWEIPAAFGAGVIAAGLLTASAPSKAPVRGTLWLGAGTVAMGWVAMIAAGLVVLSEIELQQSRTAAAEERIADGIRRAEAANTVQPWSAEPYTQLALLEEQRGDIEAALAELRSAESRDPGDWRLPMIEARLQTKRGDRPAATSAVARARSLNRLLPVPRASEHIKDE